MTREKNFKAIAIEFFYRIWVSVTFKIENVLLNPKMQPK